MSISPHFEMSGDEARGLLYGLLESDKIQLRKYPEMPSVRQGIQDGTIVYRQADPDEHWQTYKEIVDQIAFNGVAYADCEDLATAIAAEDQVRYGVLSLPYAYNPKPGLFHVVTAVPSDQFGKIPSGNWPAARGATPVPGYTYQDPSAAAGMGSFGALPSSEARMDQYGALSSEHGAASTAAAYVAHGLPGSTTKVLGDNKVGVFVPHGAGHSINKVVRLSAAASRKYAARTYGDKGVTKSEGPSNVAGGVLVTFESGTLHLGPTYGARRGGRGGGLFRSLGGVIEAFRKGAIGDVQLAEAAYQAGAGAREATGLKGGWATGLGEQLPGALGLPTIGKPEPEAPPKGSPPAPPEDDEDEGLDEEEEEFGILYGFDDVIEAGVIDAMGGLIGPQHFHALASPSGFTRANTLLAHLDEDDEFGALFEDDEDDDEDDFGYDGYAEGHTPMDRILAAEEAYGHLRPPSHMQPPSHMVPPHQRATTAPKASFGEVYAEGHTPMDRILAAEEAYGDDDDDDDDDDGFGWFGARDDMDDVIDVAVFGVISRSDLFGGDEGDDEGDDLFGFISRLDLFEDDGD